MTTEEQDKEIIACLVDFVKRVSEGKCSNEEETKILPAIVTLLKSF